MACCFSREKGAALACSHARAGLAICAAQDTERKTRDPKPYFIDQANQIERMNLFINSFFFCLGPSSTHLDPTWPQLLWNGSRTLNPNFPMRTFGGHHDDVVDVSWAPNSLFLATCGKDMAVRIWSLNPLEGFEHMALV